MQNRVHGFHHVSNNKLPQSNTARILIKTNNVTSSDVKAMVHLMYHGQLWFNLNVPWPARVYKICTLEFAFEVRWFHGTCTLCTVSLCLVHDNIWCIVYYLECAKWSLER